MTTPILQLDEWQQGQSQPHVPVNTAIRWLEFFSQMSVLSATTDTPPGSPSDGDAYIVPTGATGVWSDQDGRVALRVGTAWAFREAPIGSLVWVQDESIRYRQYASLQWSAQLRVRTIAGTSGAFQTSDCENVIETTNSSEVTIEIPADDDELIPVGATILIRQIGTGQVVIDPGDGVTVLYPAALSAATREQYSTIAATKRGANSWILSGDLEVAGS